MTSQAWAPIEPIPNDWQDLESQELPTLSRLWLQRRESLVDQGLVRQFNERIAREWAIETGVIEGLYTLDRGTTTLLIEHGIDEALISHDATDSPPSSVVETIRNHCDALDFVFAFVSGEQPLTNHFIRELHTRLTRSQKTTEGRTPAGEIVHTPLLHGQWKQQANNPTRSDGSIHEYCPPFQVQAEMQRLTDLYSDYEKEGVAADVLSAWLHHRFAQIHPFQDGNGRVARALGSIALIRAGWFPLVVRRDDRKAYIDTLERADGGDLRPLVSFVGEVEKGRFLRALTLAEQVTTERQSVRDVLSAIVDRVSGAASTEQVVQRAQTLADKLSVKAYERLRLARDEIRTVVKPAIKDLQVSADLSRDDNSFWYRGDTIQAARGYDYFADVQRYHSWARLKMEQKGRNRFEIIVTFAPVGRADFGVMAATAIAKGRTENGEGAVTNSFSPLAESIFQFNGLDEERTGATEARFDDWLQQAEIAGLEEWRKTY